VLVATLSVNQLNGFAIIDSAGKLGAEFGEVGK
jgi:hypothetical protein